jgi:hypothetical protein
MRRESQVTHAIPKGRLWTRGVALAEAEIGVSWTPIGRWSRAAEASDVGLSETESRGAQRRMMEEPALQGMAA